MLLKERFEFWWQKEETAVLLTPLPGGKLEVKPAGKLPEELREQLRQRKAEVLALLNRQQAPSP